ncbi:hypothetical protein C4564_04945 [Candidatus Microgenomates bacterium]|nr:MAG: hypothetical protein C4564_04945 [Candidatus Microgenomates bacterium]
MPAKKKKKRIRPVIEEVVTQTPESAGDILAGAPVEGPPEDKADTPEQTPEPVQKEATDPASEPTQETDEPTKSKKTNFKMIFVITVISALVAAFVSGGVYVYLNGLNELDKPFVNQGNADASPTASPTSAPTATPEPEEIDISKLSLSVLNGSGAIGAAGKAQDILEFGGFSVEHTGNAANYSFKSTTIQVKSNVEAGVVSKLKTLLSDSYKPEVGDTLPDSSKYDIVVTVGEN